MDDEIIKTVGGIAGIGGLALGVVLLIYRDIVRKTMFPKLSVAAAERLLRLMVQLVFAIGVIGIGAWELVALNPPQQVKADCSGVAIGGNVSGAIVSNSGNCSKSP